MKFCLGFTKNKIQSDSLVRNNNTGHVELVEVGSKVKPFNEMEREEQIRTTREDRFEFLNKLRLFKFYIASDFFEDNIGKVELV